MGTVKMCTAYGLIRLIKILTKKKISKHIVMEFTCWEIQFTKSWEHYFVIFVAVPVLSDMEMSASKRHISSNMVTFY